MGSEESAIDVNDESREKFIALSNNYLALCYQCGTCTSACPWSLVREFNVRKFLRSAQLGSEEALGDLLWLCTTCSLCLRTCPKGVKVFDVSRGLRGIVVERGHVPDTIRDVLTSIYRYGNTWTISRGERAEWADGLDLNLLSKEPSDTLLHLCCASCFDPRMRKAARALAETLRRAKVDFGVLGAEESCCGDPAFQLGEPGLFEWVAASNVELFTKYGVKKIITTSPHSYNVFKHEYPRYNGNYDVMHYTQLLWKLIEDGRLTFTKHLNMTVTYHDPCYLGRHNEIYREPRMILESIPGLKLVEMDRNMENSLCCGGGGGRMWLETPAKERFSNLRVKEAEGTSAEYLVTACPYCIQNFEDSVKVLDSKMKVLDIAEIVRMVL